MAARGVFRGHGSAKEQLPAELRVFWGGHGVEIGLSTRLHSPPPPPLDCCASGRRSALAAVSGHQVVFFALSVLATLSCRTSHAWRLSALSPSSHLENEATASALWSGSAAAAPTKTHTSADAAPNCSTAEKKKQRSHTFRPSVKNKQKHTASAHCSRPLCPPVHLPRGMFVLTYSKC